MVNVLKEFAFVDILCKYDGFLFVPFSYTGSTSAIRVNLFSFVDTALCRSVWMRGVFVLHRMIPQICLTQYCAFILAGKYTNKCHIILRQMPSD